MSLINLNTYPTAGSISNTDIVIVNGAQYTALQLQAYVGGSTAVFSGSETILKADKNTGRGTFVTLAQLKAFVGGSSSPVTATDIFLIINGSTYKKATGTVMQSYLDTFDLNSLSNLQVWLDATDNSTISNSGSNLTQLRDKSGNNNHCNPTGVKPTITTESTTGKQVINMDPSDSGLPLTTELVNSTFTLFLVYKILIHSGSTVYLAGATGHLNYVTTQADNSIIGIGGAGTQTYQWDESDNEMAVICIRQNSGVVQTVEYNGRQRIRTTGSVPSNPFYMGVIGAYNGGLWAGGKFAGFAYYNTWLSDSDAKRVARKLAQTHNVNATPYYKIIAYGDSHTVGVGADTNNGWAYQVATALGKKIANQGISGSLFQDISGTDSNSGYNRYNRTLIEFPTSDRLYIMYGFNDIPNGSATISRYTSELTTMVTDLLAAGYPASRIYLGTIPRYYGDNHSSLVQDYGTVVRNICATYGLHCAEVYNAIIADGRGDALYYSDNIHFNNAGHTVIANAFLSA